MESRNARLQRVVVDTRRGQVAVAVELVLIRRHRPVRQVRSAPQHGHAAGQTASLSAPRNLLVQALHQACVARSAFFQQLGVTPLLVVVVVVAGQVRTPPCTNVRQWRRLR